MGAFGFYCAIGLFIIGVLSFIFNGGGNLIMLIICLELILLSIGILLINQSVGLDDLVGSTLCLYLQPLAGAESAVALALLIAYYPTRGSLKVN